MTSKASWAQMWSISVECISELRCSGNEHKSEFKHQQTYNCQMRIKKYFFFLTKDGSYRTLMILDRICTSHVNLDSKFVGFFLWLIPYLPLCFGQNGSLCLLNIGFPSLKGVRAIVPLLYMDLLKYRQKSMFELGFFFFRNRFLSSSSCAWQLSQNRDEKWT